MRPLCVESVESIAIFASNFELLEVGSRIPTASLIFALRRTNFAYPFPKELDISSLYSSRLYRTAFERCDGSANNHSCSPLPIGLAGSTTGSKCCFSFNH